jgi:hypothetical protein
VIQKSPPGRGAARHLAAQLHVTVEEASNLWVGLDAVGALDQTVPFIFEAQVFYGHIACSERRDNLFRLADRHARIVRV